MGAGIKVAVIDTGVADIIQVAPNVKILPIRVLGPDGSGAAALALGEANLKVKPKDLGKKLNEASYDVSGRGRNDRYKKDLLDGRLDLDSFLQKVLKK